MRLKNKVAVITGSGAGIGRACAIEFAREGARAVVADIDAGGNPVDVTLSVGNGTLTLNGTTGLVFSAGDGSADALGTQIAGKNSSVAPGAQRWSIRAVETNTDTGVCQSRLTGAQTVEFGFECSDPSTCAAGQTALIDGVVVPGNAFGSVSRFNPVTLTFDANGFGRNAMLSSFRGSARRSGSLQPLMRSTGSSG